jgi:hypothetical protein
MLDTVRFVLSSPDFQRTVPFALALLAAGVLLWPSRKRLPVVPLGGLAFAAAALYGLTDTPVVTRGLLIATGVYATAGLIRDFVHLPVIADVVLAAPGAWLVSQALPGEHPAWLGPVVLAVLVTAGPLLASFDRSQIRPPLGPVFMAISVSAAFLTLPDTEEVLALLPLAAALALCGWPLMTIRLGAAGSYATLAVFVAVIAWDGRGRAASMIGALAALLVPVLWALLVTGVPRRGTATSWNRAWLLTAVHVLVALLAARVVGLRASVPTAAALTLAVAVCSTVVLVLLARAWSRLE